MHIDNYEFGKYIIDGKQYEYDIKIINNKISFWHDHGLNLEDVKELVAAKPSTIIIGTGYSGVIQVNNDIVEYIKKNKIKLIIKKTKQACEEFNKLNGKKKVAAILHGTC